MKRVLMLAALAGCGGGQGGGVDRDATVVPGLEFDAAPGSPDARPGAADARAGAPDARPARDAPPAPDARPGAPDAGRLCSGADCLPCTSEQIDSPIVAGSPDDPNRGVFDIAAQGSRVFLARGAPGIEIWDLDDAGHPTLAGSYATTGPAWGVAIRDDLLYVADGDNGLVILDVADPAHITPKGGTVFTGAQHVALDGNFAYVASWAVALRVIEIDDPTMPLPVGGYFNTTQKANDVAISGGRAYVADYSGAVLVFDIGNPFGVKLLGTVSAERTGAIGNVAAAGNTLYLADLELGVLVYDATDPVHPRVLGSFRPQLWGDAEDVWLDGSRLYVAFGARGLEILDVSDAANPRSLGTYRVPGGASQVALAGGYLVTEMIGRGLRVIDPRRVAAVSQVTAVGTLDDSIRRRMASDGTYLYVASAGDGLEVIDLSSGVPTRIAAAPVAGGHALDLSYRDGLVFVAGGQAGLVVYSVADPRHPMVVGSLPLPEVAGFVAVDGDWAYVYGYDHKSLFSIFVGNPARPGLGGTLTDAGDVQAVAARGGWVFLANFYSGLSAVDVSDPYHAKAAGTARLNFSNDGARAVALDGDRALVATEGQGLVVVDIGDPGHPAMLGAYDTPGTAVAVTVAGGLAYVGEGEAAFAPPDVQIVDYANPAAPVQVLALDAPGLVSDIAVLGRSILVLVDNSSAEDELVLRRVCAPP